jgi:hypothetical protein
MAKRADWSRPLPRPLVIPKVMALKTLADVRTLLRHLPDDRCTQLTWRHVADQLAQAARGEVEPKHVSIALRMVLSMEGVECRPKPRVLGAGRTADNTAPDADCYCCSLKTSDRLPGRDS